MPCVYRTWCKHSKGWWLDNCTRTVQLYPPLFTLSAARQTFLKMMRAHHLETCPFPIFFSFLTFLCFILSLSFFLSFFPRCNDNELPESEQALLEEKRANRSLFVQDLLVSTLETAGSLLHHGDDYAEDFEEDAENVLTISDTPEGAELVAAPEENALANDMELINLEDDNEKEL